MLDECAACGGVWLDARTFERLVKSRDEQAVVSVRSGSHTELAVDVAHAGVVEKPRYLPCPECGQLMNRKNFSNTSGVIVDICRAHGIWFDRDELGRIVHFVTNGGLDESRRRELERLEQTIREKHVTAFGAGAAAVSEVHFGADSGLVADLMSALRHFFGSPW